VAEEELWERSSGASRGCVRRRLRSIGPASRSRGRAWWIWHHCPFWGP